jgi:hypothetical protein
MIRSALLAVAALSVLAALFFARPHPTPGPPMRDFEAYYAAGNTWQDGGDPYSVEIWQSEKRLAGVSPQRYEMLPFVGPPAILPVWGVFAHFPFSAANVLWRSVLLLFTVVLVLLTLRVTAQRVTAFTFIAGAVFALGFGPLTSAIALGQFALPAYVCAVFALIWLPAGIFAWGQPNVALSLLSVAGRLRGALMFTGGLTVFAVACIAVAGPQGTLHYLSVLHAHGQAEQFSAIQITPAAIAYGFGLQPNAATNVGVAVAICTAVLWFALMRSVPDNLTRFCATCALLPLAMPFFHEHDLVILLVPSFYCVLRCSARQWPFAATASLLCATDWLGLAQRPDGEIQTLLLVGAAGVALFVLREDLHLRALLVPAAALAAIAVAGVFASAHPAPVWPDAMHGLSNVMPQHTALAWHAEQVATGLMAPNAMWALLRCLPLAGCALLAFASFASSRSPVRSRSPLPAPA